MFRFLFCILKKIVVGMVILFGYNTFLSSLNLMIPINVITIMVVSLFDVPGVIGLVLFLLFNF